MGGKTGFPNSRCGFKALSARFVSDRLQDNMLLFFWNMINYVDYLQHCYYFPNRFSHLLSLVKIKEGKNGFDTFATIWICSHNKDASKCRSEAISGKCIHQKQAGEQPHGLSVTYTSSMEDIQQKPSHFKDLKVQVTA